MTPQARSLVLLALVLTSVLAALAAWQYGEGTRCGGETAVGEGAPATGSCTTTPRAWRPAALALSGLAGAAAIAYGAVGATRRG